MGQAGLQQWHGEKPVLCGHGRDLQVLATFPISATGNKPAHALAMSSRGRCNVRESCNVSLFILNMS
jgi:hypothetical protein